MGVNRCLIPWRVYIYIGYPMVFGRIKIISNHKPWVILFITYFNDSLLLFYIFVMSFNMQKILMLFQQYCAKSIMTSLVWDIKNLFTGYGGKYVINIYIYVYTYLIYTWSFVFIAESNYYVHLY